jgi:hypothetical protein
MKRKFNQIYILGIFMAIIGLILIVLFNHNMNYWIVITQLSTFLIIFGFGFILISIWEKFFVVFIRKLEKGSIKIQFFKILIILITFVFSFSFVTLGESLNYKLRNYFLSKNIIETNGIIENVIQLRIIKIKQKDFYLIKSIKDKRVQIFKLPVDYVKKDNYNLNNNLIKYDLKTLNIKSLKNLKIKIIYSNKFNSFVKIVD